MGSWGSLHAVAARPHASSSNLHTNHGPYRTGRSFPSCPRLGRYHTETKVPPSSSTGTVAASNEAVAALRQQQRRDSNGVEAAAASRQQQPRQHWPSRGVRKYSSKCTRIEFRDRQINCPRRPPPVEFRDRQRHTVTVPHRAPPGRVLGQTRSVHANPPGRVSGQTHTVSLLRSPEPTPRTSFGTDRVKVHTGDTALPPRSSFGTHTDRQTDSIIIGTHTDRQTDR